jgi:hypothetical protein
MSGLRWPAGRHERRQQPRGAFGERGIGGHGGELILPQIDIAPGESGKIGRIRHGTEYTGAGDHEARARARDAVCWISFTREGKNAQ